MIYSLKKKVFWSISIILFCCGIISMTIVNRFMTAEIYRSYIGNLKVEAAAMENAIKQSSDVNRLNQTLREWASRNPRLKYLFFLDRQGTLLAWTSEIPKEILQLTKTHAAPPGYQIVNIHGETLLSYAHPINLLGTLYLEVSINALQRSLFEMQWTLILLGTAFAGFGLGMIYFFTVFFTNPIAQLVTIVAQVDAGNLDLRAPCHQKDEIGVLARSFNQMMDTLQGNLTQIQRERDKFQAMMDNMQEGVIYINEYGEYDYINAAVWKTHHCLPNRSQPALLWDEDPQEVHRQIQAIAGQYSDRSQIGQQIPKILKNNIEATYAPVFDKEGDYRGFIEVSQDISERLKLEQQIHRSERLAIVGELAAGVAHEINNPLDGVQNSLRIIHKNPHHVKQIESLLPMMIEALNRIEFIVKKLLTFSRKQALQKEEFPVCQLISESLNFVMHKIKNQGIELCYSPPEPPIKIWADERQLSQALINILLNAIDSMERGEKKLTITVQSTMRGSQEMIAVAVQDTGTGMVPDTMSRLFNPFFTTKKEGKGTGLGLSVSQNIVREHNGEIEVDSVLEKGSTFTILVPASLESIRKLERV